MTSKFDTDGVWIDRGVYKYKIYRDALYFLIKHGQPTIMRILYIIRIENGSKKGLIKYKDRDIEEI
jgi:hypothetical protein